LLYSLLLQSNGHDGSTTQLEFIRSQLKEKDRSLHKFVFVIPRANSQTFKFQTDLGDIKQYVLDDDDAVASYETLFTTEEMKAVGKREINKVEGKKGKGKLM
jgi:hypothetical protein